MKALVKGLIDGVSFVSGLLTYKTLEDKTEAPAVVKIGASTAAYAGSKGLLTLAANSITMHNLKKKLQEEVEDDEEMVDYFFEDDLYEDYIEPDYSEEINDENKEVVEEQPEDSNLDESHVNEETHNEKTSKEQKAEIKAARKARMNAAKPNTDKVINIPDEMLG